MPEALKSDTYATDSQASKTIAANGGTFVANKDINNVHIDAEDRYWVAVGPNVMNETHKSTDPISPNEMNYGTKLDIHVLDEITGKDYYVPVVVGDDKAHSWPDGLYQTGDPFPGETPDPGHGDGSSAEFIGYQITVDSTGKSTINITNEYL